MNGPTRAPPHWVGHVPGCTEKNKKTKNKKTKKGCSDMRIHTTADEGTIRAAAKLARVDFVRFTVHGSRRSARAFYVTLTGESSRISNGGRTIATRRVHAATWDQWGVFLAAIFAADPNAWCREYDGSWDFEWKTGYRFGDGWPSDAHGDHRWEVGIPYSQSCRRCSATRRWGR